MSFQGIHLILNPCQQLQVTGNCVCGGWGRRMCVRAHARVCAKLKTDFGPGAQFEHNIAAMNMQGNLNVCLSATEYLARGELK